VVSGPASLLPKAFSKPSSKNVQFSRTAAGGHAGYCLSQGIFEEISRLPETLFSLRFSRINRLHIRILKVFNFIPVMGVIGAGKSTFISLCTKEEVPVGHELLSCMFSRSRVWCYLTALYTLSRPHVYSLRRKDQIMRLIDIPGFDDSKRPDIDILTELAFYLTGAYQANPKLLLSGAIYLQPINEPRLQGTVKNLTMFKLLCGDESLHSVVLATTMWRQEIEANGMKRQTQLETIPEFWGNTIEHGSTVFRHDNTPESALRIIDHIVEKRVNIVLSIQRQTFDLGKNIDQTSAGQVQRAEIIREKDKAERRLQKKQGASRRKSS
jgi:hypothetical protein